MSTPAAGNGRRAPSHISRDDVYADPRKEVNDDEYEFAVEQTREWIEQRPDEVVELLSLHGF